MDSQIVNDLNIEPNDHIYDIDDSYDVKRYMKYCENNLPSCDNEKIRFSNKYELQMILEHETTNCPVLIYTNKQDLTDVATPTQIQYWLQIDKICGNRPF
jgi:signal recognition particle receptor subunit beta